MTAATDAAIVEDTYDWGRIMRVAIVHDYLTQFGGAERVLLALMKLFPHAPVFTLVFDPRMAFARTSGPGIFDTRRLRTSFLQRIPGARARHRYFPILMPLAIEQFDFSQYDLVFSATHSFGKGVICGPQTLHISYCFTPTRYLWDDSHRYIREFSRSPVFQRLAPIALSYIRLWDYYASQRVTTYLTLSNFVARRIQKYYRRDAQVVPPPVDVNRFKVTPGGDYYLIVSRLVPYKRIDLAIEACERLQRPLKIVGTGPEEKLLHERARFFSGQKKTFTEFLGFVPDEKLPALYKNARALLFPQEEDFGITPLEAAAAGKPTIAYGFGGARETVIDGITGIFFLEQTAGALMRAMLVSESTTFNSADIRHHAERFSEDQFLQEIEQIVHSEWMSFKSKHQTRL